MAQGIEIITANSKELFYILIQSYDWWRRKHPQRQGPVLLTWLNFDPSMDK